MGGEVQMNGMAPEQKAGLAVGAGLTLAGLAFGFLRRRKKKQSRARTTAERIVENPSLRNLYSTARETLEEAQGQIDPKTIEAAKKELARRAETGSERWHSEVEPAARELADRAMTVAQRVRTEGGARTRELSKRWDKEYGPAAKSAAEDAIHEADEIITNARKKASEFSDVARKEYIPRIGPLATAAGGAIASMLSEKSEQFSKNLRDGSKPDVTLPKLQRKSSQTVLQRTGQGAKTLAGQVLMIGFWGAALGTVVYYGLLDEERRQKVRSFCTDAYEQVSELIEDFQDADDFGEAMESAERF